MTRPARSVLALIDLVQDLDVLLPVLIGAAAAPDLRLQILVSRWLARRAPRIPALLKAARLSFRYVDRSRLLKGQAPTFDGVDLLLTASESSAGPHRWVRAAVERARARGLVALTVQHGLDNLRTLTGDQGRDFASDLMFCWPPEEAIPTSIPSTLRARLEPVGRPAPPLSGAAPVFDLAVFENLHSAAYDDDARETFMARLLGLAGARPDLRLYVRSHPAGGWLDAQARRLAGCRNMTFIPSFAARRSVEHPAAAIDRSARVVTTPSTVALDAVQSGRPVALATDGGPLYGPLPVLNTLEDWVAFADVSVTPAPYQADFLACNVRSGDPVARILARMTTL